MNIAFLGLGAIGEPMASHLAHEPFVLTVWNRSSDKAREFGAKYGVRVAATAAEAVIGADVVITCVPSSREVEELVTGGVAQAMLEGSILVDCTSGDPATSRRVAESLHRCAGQWRRERSDCRYLDDHVRRRRVGHRPRSAGT